MDGDESRGFPDPRRGAPGPSPGCDCRGPAGGLEPQRVRPVVLDRSAADGALGTQGPGPATPHATLRYGEDVRADGRVGRRSEEHTSELQSLTNLVCRLLLEKKKNNQTTKGMTTASHTPHTPRP